MSIVVQEMVPTYRSRDGSCCFSRRWAGESGGSIVQVLQDVINMVKELGPLARVSLRIDLCLFGAVSSVVYGFLEVALGVVVRVIGE